MVSLLDSLQDCADVEVLLLKFIPVLFEAPGVSEWTQLMQFAAFVNRVEPDNLSQNVEVREIWTVFITFISISFVTKMTFLVMIELLDDRNDNKVKVQISPKALHTEHNSTNQPTKLCCQVDDRVHGLVVLYLLVGQKEKLSTKNMSFLFKEIFAVEGCILYADILLTSPDRRIVNSYELKLVGILVHQIPIVHVLHLVQDYEVIVVSVRAEAQLKLVDKGDTLDHRTLLFLIVVFRHINLLTQEILSKN